MERKQATQLWYNLIASLQGNRHGRIRFRNPAKRLDDEVWRGDYDDMDQQAFADLSHAVGQADGRRRLAFAGGRGRDRRDEDQLAVGALAVSQQVDIVDLGLVAAVELKVFLVDPGGLRHLGDGLHGRGMGDLDVGLVRHKNDLSFVRAEKIFCAVRADKNDE